MSQNWQPPPFHDVRANQKPQKLFSSAAICHFYRFIAKGIRNRGNRQQPGRQIQEWKRNHNISTNRVFYNKEIPSIWAHKNIYKYSIADNAEALAIASAAYFHLFSSRLLTRIPLLLDVLPIEMAIASLQPKNCACVPSNFQKPIQKSNNLFVFLDSRLICPIN